MDVYYCKILKGYLEPKTWFIEHVGSPVYLMQEKSVLKFTRKKKQKKNAAGLRGPTISPNAWYVGDAVATPFSLATTVPFGTLPAKCWTVASEYICTVHRHRRSGRSRQLHGFAATMYVTAMPYMYIIVSTQQ